MSTHAAAEIGQPQRPPGLVVRIGGGVAVLGVASWVAVEGLPEWEERLFGSLNGGPAGLEAVLWLPMQLGSLFGPVVVGAFTWRKWRNWRVSVGAVVSGAVSWQLAKGVKAAVDRGRPYELLADFARRAGTPYEGSGFVSGHSAVAFSMAAVFSPHLSKPQRALAYLLAAVVGTARIQISAHLPTDVIGGAALGYTLGNVWNLAVGVPSSQGSSIHAGADSSRNLLTSRHRSSTSQSISSPR